MGGVSLAGAEVSFIIEGKGSGSDPLCEESPCPSMLL